MGERRSKPVCPDYGRKIKPTLMSIDLTSFVLGGASVMLYTLVVTHKPKKQWRPWHEYRQHH